MRSNGQRIVSNLKLTAGGQGVQLRLKIVEFEKYFLRPIPTRPLFLDQIDIACLTDWRNLYPTAFLTEFRATALRTQNWLVNTVHNDPGRIMFMIENESMERFGYMGLAFIDWSCCYGEVDAVVRGRPTEKGLMTASLKALIKWSRNQLEIKKIGVRVLSDNPAILFYKKAGFIENKRVPLKKETSDGLVNWVEKEDYLEADRHLVHHIYSK